MSHRCRGVAAALMVAAWPNSQASFASVRNGSHGQQELLAPDGAAGDRFGSSVAISGDSAVVGAYARDTPAGADAGSAYVFVRSATGWTAQQELAAPDGAPGDFFGVSVTIAGDTVVIGARLHDTGAGADAGSAYVFVRSGTAWTLQQELLASDAAAGDSFGTSVSLSGDTLVVGAPVADTAGGVDAGAAYIFVRSGAGWAEQQKILPSDARALEDFGYSASLSGDTVVMGAPSDDLGVAYNAGSAYVFVRSGGSWVERQKLLAPDGARHDHFGFAVSVSGDTVVAGAFLDDTAGGTDAGSANVFVRSGGTWAWQQKLLASDAAHGDYFGFAVSVAGETAVVGAPRDDTSAGVDGGSAYVFVRSGTTWTEQQKLSAPDASAGDSFGYGVSISAKAAVVGAPADDTQGGADAGSAHVVHAAVPVELEFSTVE